MNNTCWESITEKEYKYWLVEVGKSHHIFTEEGLTGGEVFSFIEDKGLVKHYILCKTKLYNKTNYYKNSNVIGS